MAKRNTFTLTRHLRNGRDVTTAGHKPGQLRSLIAYALTDNGLASVLEAREFAGRFPGAGITETVGHASGYRFTVVREI